MAPNQAGSQAKDMKLELALVIRKLVGAGALHAPVSNRVAGWGIGWLDAPTTWCIQKKQQKNRVEVNVLAMISEFLSVNQDISSQRFFLWWGKKTTLFLGHSRTPWSKAI